MAESGQKENYAAAPFGPVRFLPVALVILLGVALSLAGFRAMTTWEESKVRNELERQSVSIAAAVRNGIHRNIEVLSTLRDLYAARGVVSRQEFKLFLDKPLQRHPEIQALEWVPQVAQAERQAYVAAAHAEGYSSFAITEQNTAGRMVRAAPRDFYYPVYFVEPYAGNDKALGFDLGSNAVRRAALELARDTAGPIATARITLVQETAQQFGLLVFEPVYRLGTDIDAVAARRAGLQGFILGVFRIGDLVENGLRDFVDPGGIDLYIYDDSAPAPERFLHFRPSRLHGQQVEPLPESQITTGLFAQTSFMVAGRTWSMLFKPVPGSFEASRITSIATLLAGLLLTAILAAYLFSTLQRASRIERLVGERTAALSRSNRALESEAVERQEIQDALRDSESRLKAIFENSPLSIFLKSVDGRFIAVNRQYEIDNDITSEKIRGKTVFDLYPESFAQNMTDHDRDTLKAGHMIRRELVERRPDGDRHYLVTKFLLRDVTGKVTSICGMETDITSLKEAERIALENEKRTRGIVETVVDGIVTIDAKGDIETFNSAAEKIFGYAAQEVLGCNVKILMPEPYHGEHDGYLTRYLVTGEKKIIGIGREVRGRRKNGQVFPLELAISEMETGGRRAFTGVIRDISERKRAAEQLRRYTVALEQSNQELQQFARVASHDLREPLRKIQTFGELLESADDQKLSSEGRDYLARMVNAAERMQMLVDDLFEFALVTQRARPFVSVELTEVVQEVLSDLEIQIEDSGATIELGELPRIDADPRQMRQLFQNLIGNALKFRHKEIAPKVKLSSRPVDGSDQAHDRDGLDSESCEICIVDNGIGFDEKHGTQIFEVFKRLHGRSDYPGSGIGLATCRKIVEYHGGTIAATSEPGEGANFVVRLPMRHESDLKETEAAPKKSLTDQA